MTRMKFLTALAALTLSAALIAAAKSKDTKVYELRIYHAAPGKLDDLNKRFREHTTKLFEKHGMENIGYWTPIDNTNNLLIYVLAHKSREDADKSWKAFGSDPDWQSARKASEVNGALVTKADRFFMRATDYSAEIKPKQSSPQRVFELRDYTASEGNLANLDARFRDHTVKLFEKHGMENFGYWHPEPAKDGKQNRLIYLLAHKSKEAGEASFSAFRKDPTWVAAKEASEKQAGGSLTEGGQAGVKSTYMVPTDYSPTK